MHVICFESKIFAPSQSFGALSIREADFSHIVFVDKSLLMTSTVG